MENLIELTQLVKDLLKRLNTDERKTILGTKTLEGNEIFTPLIVAACNRHLNSIKILLSYKTDIKAHGLSVLTGYTGLQAATLKLIVPSVSIIIR